MLSFATKHNDPNGKLGWPERIGYGAALAVFLLIVILLIHGLQNLFFSDKRNR